MKLKKQNLKNGEIISLVSRPNTDCDLCPNYNFNDLIDFYWPALVGGVLAYTGENKVDYIGYSSSGGVGIRSYEKWKDGKSGAGLYVDENDNWIPFNLPANSVDHMALIAPMGSFNAVIPSPVELCLLTYGDEVNDLLVNNNHISRDDVAGALLIASVNDGPLNIPGTDFDFLCTTAAVIAWNFGPTPKISYNVWNYTVNDIIQNQNDAEPGLSSIDRTLIVKGSFFDIFSDVLIPGGDINVMYDNTNANKKYKARVFWPHYDMPNKAIGIYDPLIAKFLNDQNYSSFERIIYLIEED